MLIYESIPTLARLFATAFVLAVVAACGQVDRVNDRSRGSGAITIQPQKVRGGDDVKMQQPDPAVSEAAPLDETAEENTPDTGASQEEIQSVLVAAGLRNYEQINATMATVTGVPSTTAAVRTLYNEQLATSLPTDNDVRTFLGSQQVAVYKLAVAYCEALVTNATLRGSFFGTVNLAAAPNVALNAAGKAAVADALISRLWGKGLESLPPHGENTAQVVSLLDQLLAGKSMTNAAVTPVVVIGACTATLASAPVTMF